MTLAYMRRPIRQWIIKLLDRNGVSLKLTGSQRDIYLWLGLAGNSRRLVPSCHEAAQCQSEAPISSPAHPSNALHDTGGDSMARLRRREAEPAANGIVL